ncbi:MAG: transposase [Chitinophagaceae bacterium]|nr:transposase [Chitinophagaceae bacterium]
MKEKQILAIDVSKRSLDICVRPAGTTFKISNDLSGFKVLTAAISPDLDPLVVMEHTGLYSFQLEKYLEGQGVPYCKIPALEIKRSMGWFGARTTRSIPYGSPSMPGLGGHNSYRPQNHRKVTRLNQLLSLRAKLVKDCGGYKARIKEMLDTELISKSDLIYKLQRTVMTTLNSQIQKVEKEIEVLIETDPELKKNFDLIRTIKGVGKIVAARMLAVTSNFKKFSNARKFNCYAGLAPFKHESGTSIRGRSRVSHLANKEIKTVLNLAAFCAIRFNQELKIYYEKRVSEGMKKMSCINIIRAKNCRTNICRSQAPDSI